MSNSTSETCCFERYNWKGSVLQHERFGNRCGTSVLQFMWHHITHPLSFLACWLQPSRNRTWMAGIATIALLMKTVNVLILIVASTVTNSLAGTKYPSV